MRARYLVDTCIWIDIMEDRKGFSGESLAKSAIKILLNIKTSGGLIVISDFQAKEFINNFTESQIKSMLNVFEKNIERITLKPSQLAEAQIISKIRSIPYGDALHAITAGDNDLVLITRDKHFKQLKDICSHYLPEDLA